VELDVISQRDRVSFDETEWLVADCSFRLCKTKSCSPVAWHYLFIESNIHFVTHIRTVVRLFIESRHSISA
jgi:hypothetical protein